MTADFHVKTLWCCIPCVVCWCILGPREEKRLNFGCGTENVFFLILYFLGGGSGECTALQLGRRRGEITIFTPPVSLSDASTLQNKSQCLGPNFVWQRVAAGAILASLWCQSPISAVTFFTPPPKRKSRFPRDSALLQLPQCIRARRSKDPPLVRF